jgi:hypothetical protein
MEKSSRVRKALLGLRAPFENLCYTPEEFRRKRKELCVVMEAVRSGIRII